MRRVTTDQYGTKFTLEEFVCLGCGSVHTYRFWGEIPEGLSLFPPRGPVCPHPECGGALQSLGDVP